MNWNILISALVFIVVAGAGYAVCALVSKIGIKSFFEKFWHVTALPEVILASVFAVMNIRGITATGHFVWWLIRIVMVVAQLFLIPKLMKIEKINKNWGYLCAGAAVVFQILNSSIVLPLLV